MPAPVVEYVGMKKKPKPVKKPAKPGTKKK